MNTETLTCKVSEARADYGITQQQLADATGISVRTIISIEKGHQLPSLLSAMRIANYFSLTVDQLFEYKKTNPITYKGGSDHEKYSNQFPDHCR